MWKCPKCGREFKKRNQDHYCSVKPETVEAYIDLQREEIRPLLYRVREAIRGAIPQAEERISWGMPTYWKGCNLIHFAANKNHLGIYVSPQAVEEFAEALKGLKSHKGSIQFPYEKDWDTELIARMAAWCYEERERP